MHRQDVALQWLGELGFTPKHGPHIAPDELHAEAYRLRRDDPVETAA